MKKRHWHIGFIIVATIWVLIAFANLYPFPFFDKELVGINKIEKERLDSVASGIIESFEWLNKKRNSNATLTVREEECFEIMNKKKVLGLPKIIPELVLSKYMIDRIRADRRTKSEFLKDLGMTKFSEYSFSSELSGLDNATLDKYKNEERSLIVNHRWRDLAELLIKQYAGRLNFSDIEDRYKLNLRKYHEYRRYEISEFYTILIVPIGLGYLSCWCVVWIIRGYRNLVPKIPNAINIAKKKKHEISGTKICPYCAETIKEKAVICRCCHQKLD